MPVLFIKEPGYGIRPYRFERRAIIGRDHGNDIRLEHRAVSGHHALVWVLPDGRLALKDLRSSNGCTVRGKRVGSALVEDGDTFLLGELRVRYQADQEEADPMATVDWELSDSTDPALVTGPISLKAAPDSSDLRGLRGQAKALLAMYALTNAVHSTTTEEGLFRAIASLVQQNIGAPQGTIVEYDSDSDRLSVRTAWPEGQTLFGRSGLKRSTLSPVLVKGETLLLPLPSLLPSSQTEARQENAGLDVLCAPLRSPSRCHGAIFAIRPTGNRGFDERHQQLLTAIGLEAGTALENRRLYQELERDFFATVRVLVQALQARDAYTGGHAERVATISVAIARCIPLPAESVRMVRLGALLHDIGKIGVEDRCLSGTEALSERDYDHVKGHTVRGDEMLAPVRKLGQIRSIVRHHHERWDGSGYPDGLEGDAIPLEARIVAMADTLDAIVSSRSYRDGRSLEEGMAEVKRVAGTQLDPGLWKALKRARQQGFIRKGLWGFRRSPPRSGA